MAEMVQVGPNRWADITSPSNRHLKRWTPPAGSEAEPSRRKGAARTLYKYLLPFSMKGPKPADMLESEILEERRFLRAWLEMEGQEPGTLTDLQAQQKRYATARLEWLTAWGKP